MKFHKWLLCALASTVLFFDTYSITLQAGNLKNLISESGIKFGGWINGGVTFNPSQAGGYNGPVIFADQANPWYQPAMPGISEGVSTSCLAQTPFLLKPSVFPHLM
jgi:hypothetical protein